ncbi:MAG TPA: class A beta-lactamase [Gemmatimonadaceae bacterium]|nr:class A beta-lactamase [Gemmatimonadaceae bacterium]
MRVERRFLVLRAVRITLAATALLIPDSSRAQSAAGRADPGLARLEAEIGRLTKISGGKVGVGVIHLETGRELFVNRDEPFPMASTYKVPIAVQLLTKVDSGRVRLDSLVTLQPSDLHPGSGTLTELFDDPGVALSLRNLLELMLIISDNSATDVVLRTAGAGAAVNARLKTLGVSGVSVDRPTVNLIADAIGVKNLPPEKELTIKRFGELVRAVPEPDRKAASEAFYRDRRDTSTPEGMARLLEKIWRKQALSPASSDLLLDIMLRCTTGAARIKGYLPPDTPVMHKTGTLGIGVANDVGIIRLPGDAGHVAVAVFVKESTLDTPTQERAIAQISRAVYDYFTFVTGK